MPSLILARGTGKGYTDTNLQGAQELERTHSEEAGSPGMLPRTIEQEVAMMFQKFSHEPGALRYGSMKHVPSMGKARVEDGFEELSAFAPVRKKRSVMTGGMFSRTSRLYSQLG